jgi:hypothetical protein
MAKWANTVEGGCLNAVTNLLAAAGDESATGIAGGVAPDDILLCKYKKMTKRTAAHCAAWTNGYASPKFPAARGAVADADTHSGDMRVMLIEEKDRATKQARVLLVSFMGTEDHRITEVWRLRLRPNVGPAGPMDLRLTGDRLWEVDQLHEYRSQRGEVLTSWAGHTERTWEPIDALPLAAVAKRFPTGVPKARKRKRPLFNQRKGGTGHRWGKRPCGG